MTLCNLLIFQKYNLSAYMLKISFFHRMRNPLVQCMKREQRVCPESPIVMRNIGLDLDSLDKTVNVLCLHPKGNVNE